MVARHTTIVKYQNSSEHSVTSVNAETLSNSYWIPAKAEVDTQIWISHKQEKPLVIATRRGFCHVWEYEWSVYGKWEGDGKRYELARGREQGVNGPVFIMIDAGGDISLKIAG